MEDDEVKIERRIEPRVAVQVEVTLTSESNFFVGFTDNISEGGIFLATHDLLPIGSQIELEFLLPDDDQPIEVPAEIRWHRPLASQHEDAPAGFGAQFLDIGDEEQQRLEEFVASREPIFYPD